jgi:hypothetical protein
MRSALVVIGCLAAAACAPGMQEGTGGGAGGGGAVQMQQAVTWYKDVLPIAQTRCMGCHQAGGIAPFSMTDMTAVAANAQAMAADVASRKMPPWPVDETCGGPYAHSLYLSDAELKTFDDWAKGGAAVGDVKDAPPKYQPPLGLTTVDLTQAPPNPYMPQANATDDYHCFILDPGLTENKDVVAYEIDPGVAPEVHHVVLYMVDRAQAQAMDSNGAGWTCFGGTGTTDENLLGAWAPGSSAVVFPAGTGIQLPSSKVIVMQVHYNLQNGVRQADTTQAKLQFATSAVTPATMEFLIDFNFSVPPMAMGYSHSKTFNVSSASRIWGVFGHMHTQGHIVTLKSPDTCLLDIPNWDFHWQEQFFYETPKDVAAGTQLTLSCTWNNTTGNTLRFGEDTSSEMCIASIYVTH